MIECNQILVDPREYSVNLGWTVNQKPQNKDLVYTDFNELIVTQNTTDKFRTAAHKISG